MEEHNFFDTYHIDPLAFDRSGLRWETLKEISDDYNTIKTELDFLGKQVLEQILSTPHVHSINYRTKEDEHVIKLLGQFGEGKSE